MYFYAKFSLCACVCAFSIRPTRIRLRLVKYSLAILFSNLRPPPSFESNIQKTSEDNLTSETIKQPDDRKAPKLEVGRRRKRYIPIFERIDK